MLNVHESTRDRNAQDPTLAAVTETSYTSTRNEVVRATGEDYFLAGSLNPTQFCLPPPLNHTVSSRVPCL